MNIARFVMVAVPLGVVLIYFIMQSLTVGEAAHRDLVQDGKLMQDVRKRSFPGLYDAIEAGFPIAYSEHVEDIEEIALDTDVARHDLGPALMAESDAFVAELRGENAQYISLAGRGPLLEIQRAQLALLKDLAGSPELCGRVAKGGLTYLDRAGLGQVDRHLHGRWLTALVTAMAAGRDAPEEFGPPSADDWYIFLRDWREEDGTTGPEVEAYLSSQKVDPELFCTGAVTFTRRLIADTSPSGLRILADYTGSLAR